MLSKGNLGNLGRERQMLRGKRRDSTAAVCNVSEIATKWRGPKASSSDIATSINTKSQRLLFCTLEYLSSSSSSSKLI